MRSPLKSMGAWSFSPSPITTMPSIGTPLKHDPHGVDGRLVRPFLVPAAHPAPRRERRGLRHAYEFHREVPVGQLALVAHGCRR